MLKSLRSRLLLASVLWTAGLLMLMHFASLMLIHVVPGLRGMHSVWPVIVAGSLMALGLVAARASLRPLRNLDRKVVAVTRGEAARIDGLHPSEVQPVIDSLNTMIENREKSVTRAYAAAGDLAHCLKTPLALLAREADEARKAGQTQVADAIAAHVHRMSSHIDRHLARARVAAAGPPGTDRADVASSVAGLVRTVATLYVERRLTLSQSVPPDLQVGVRREDLEEILGNVLDNACKWARTAVTIIAQADGAFVQITVGDDGLGLPGPLRARVLERGVRIDETTPGSGLGLAIVRDLVEHYGGTLALDESSIGGLSVRVTLPA